MTDPLLTLQKLLGNVSDVSEEIAADDMLDLQANHLLHMDNLAAIRRVPDASLDFVYIDPPFASNATYYQQIKLPGHTITRPAYTDVWESGLSSYLAFLVPRLAAIRPLLKPTGSLCVHLGHHSSHYVKIALDALYGSDRLINEVIWRYGKMSNSRRRFPQNHDTLLVYAASDSWYFQPVYSQPSEYRTRFQRDLTDNRVLYGTVKHRADKLIQRRISSRQRDLGRELCDDDVLFDFDTERKTQDDVFTDISIIRGNAHEGVGYDTQKPRKLLERLISAYCPPEGTVADFFSGSGTTGIAAESMVRRWILADSGLAAVQTSRLRLQSASYRFHRDPDSTPGAFDIDGQQRILDFRIEDLQLPLADEAAVQHCLASAPDTLIAGTIGTTIIDIFGREATFQP